ncbi:MAG TPA: hypothetical protein VHD33_02345 [Legionellaceae bacterium]|nr:hypothetical protein [Legionellaceae bacterium]
MKKSFLFGILCLMNGLIWAASLPKIETNDDTRIIFSTLDFPERANVVVRCILSTKEHKLPQDGFIYLTPIIGHFNNIELRLKHNDIFTSQHYIETLGSKIYLKDIDMEDSCALKGPPDGPYWGTCYSKTIYITGVTQSNEAIFFDMTNVKSKKIDIDCF